MTSDDLADLVDLALAHAAVGSLLDGLSPADWARPTPCEDWDVAGVVRHVVAGDRAFTTVLGGESYDLRLIHRGLERIVDADLPATYHEAARALRAAFAVEGVAEGTFPSPLGPMPARSIAQLRTIEALTHGWDVARATARPLAVDDAVAARAIGQSQQLMKRIPPERTPFGAPQPVADDAPAVDRLAALLGRRP